MDYGEGKCLVFLHGWGGSISSFKGLADRLSADFRVIIPELYGFGKTMHPPYPLTIEDYAQGVEALLNETQADDVLLIGHSFGGRVAMRVAARNPRVSSLVLIDSAGIKPRRGISYYSKVGLYKVMKHLRIGKLPQGSEDYRNLSGVMKKTFVNVVNESSEKDAQKIFVPTLLLWGSNDRDTPLFMCKRLKRLIHGSESIVMEGAGHFSYLERADFVYRVIRAFREKI